MCKTQYGLFKTRKEIDNDFTIHGIERIYTRWYMHREGIGESISYKNEEVDDDGESMDDILEDHFGCPYNENWIFGYSRIHEPEEPNGEAAKFFRLLRDAKEKLYPDCERYSKFHFTVKLLQLKCLKH